MQPPKPPSSQSKLHTSTAFPPVIKFEVGSSWHGDGDGRYAAATAFDGRATTTDQHQSMMVSSFALGSPAVPIPSTLVSSAAVPLSSSRRYPVKLPIEEESKRLPSALDVRGGRAFFRCGVSLHACMHPGHPRRKPDQEGQGPLESRTPAVSSWEACLHVWPQVQCSSLAPCFARCSLAPCVCMCALTVLH